MTSKESTRCTDFAWCDEDHVKRPHVQPGRKDHWQEVGHMLTRGEDEDEGELTRVDVAARFVAGDLDPKVNLCVNGSREGSALMTVGETRALADRLLKAADVLEGHCEVPS